jgi:hypothetical protein
MKLSARILACVLLLCVAGAHASHAGTVYIPLPGVSTVGSAGYETQITITNNLAQQRNLNYLLLSPGVDGTKRQGVTATPLTVLATKTFVLKPTATSRGLLELNAIPGLSYSARVVRTGATDFGVELPVVTSETMATVDDRLVVQGLKGSDTTATDVVIINLSKAATTCSASVVRADGTLVFPTASLSLLPLSHLFFTDVFDTVPGGITDARVEVSCKSDFYVYAQMTDTATGEFSIATPAQTSDDSTLVPPGETPTGLTCSTGTTCYVFPGLVHQSTNGNPDRSIILTPPEAAYSSVKLHLEVTVGPWNRPNTGAHGVMYFVRDKNKDMFANVFLRGPSRNNVTLRHGFDQTHGEKAKIERGFAAQPGETYAFDYDYDPTRKTLSLRISRAGQLLVEIVDKPNVNKVHIDAGNRVIVGLSNPGTNPSVEPASIGWKYSNLKVEFFP